MMKKEMKIITVNDGTREVLTNGNRHFAEEYTWAESVLEMYVNAGYKIVQIVQDVTPTINKPGNYSFYKTGFTAFLEREVKSDNVYITEDDWRNINPMEDEDDSDDGYYEEFDFTEDDE